MVVVLTPKYLQHFYLKNRGEGHGSHITLSPVFQVTDQLNGGVTSTQGKVFRTSKLGPLPSSRERRTS